MSTGAQHAAPVVIALAPIKGSSNIAAAGYDAKRQLLDIQFHSGAVHRYEEVPAVVHEQLLSADSKGRYFGSHIRGAFSSSRIDKPTET